MARTDTTTVQTAPSADDGWYGVPAAEVVKRLAVDPAVGLSGRRVAELLERDGPNELPAEPPVSGWKRFLEQYRSYMQVILVAAAIVSLAIKQWSTGVLLILITVLNSVVGLRQEGKAESAMNALQAMVKATARVRRDGSEAEIAAEDVVVGDVVLLAAGDEVPADGRIIEASSLQIDESALTGESVPASKGVEVPEGTDLAPGEQSDMAFMHTPVTHGSAVMIVTATGSDTQVGKIAGMLREHGARADAAHAAAERADAVDRGRGRNHDGDHVRARGAARAFGDRRVLERDRAGDRGDSGGDAHRPSGGDVPRRGRPRAARRGTQGPGIGRDARLDLGDQLRQDRDFDDEPDDRGRGARSVRPVHDLGLGLRARGLGAARCWFNRHDRGRDPAVRGRERCDPRGRKGRGRPHRGGAARARTQGGPRHRRHAGAPSAAGHASVRPDVQADGRVREGVRRGGQR